MLKAFNKSKMSKVPKVVVPVRLNLDTFNALSKLAEFVGVPVQDFISDLLVAYFQIMDMLPPPKDGNSTYVN